MLPSPNTADFDPSTRASLYGPSSREICVFGRGMGLSGGNPYLTFATAPWENRTRGICMLVSPPQEQEGDLVGRVPGRPLRVVLLTFYNYESHALRIFHPLLTQRGHDVHSIFFKNYFTYQVPTPDRRGHGRRPGRSACSPTSSAMSVWSTYYQLAGAAERPHQGGRRSGHHLGRHPRAGASPQDCLEHADVVCLSEGEYVLAELTDRIEPRRAVRRSAGLLGAHRGRRRAAIRRAC